MVDTMINIVKNAAEEIDGTLTFTLYTGKKNKKKEEHNRCMMSVMELLDALIETTKFICDCCKSEYGDCSEICEDMTKWNKVIDKNKEMRYNHG